MSSLTGRLVGHANDFCGADSERDAMIEAAKALDESFRLLHVLRAWYWASQLDQDSARGDSLYPGISGSKAHLWGAVDALLKDAPYSPTVGAPHEN